MPELPEVETTRRGLEPLLTGASIASVRVRDRRLRWPVPAGLGRHLAGQTVTGVGRRAKYLLIATGNGTLIVHLGMSGSLRVTAADAPPGPHDHVDVVFTDGRALRYRDPRRFGSFHWTGGAAEEHWLLAPLGPEPLGNAFHGPHLSEAARGRRVSVKNFVMNARVVVGVGNIYASEALYLAGIHPVRAAGRIGTARYESLAAAVKRVLGDAIAAGGTTLRDFVDGHGNPGGFATRLRVYDRRGEPCERCGSPIRQRVIGQRSSFFCPRCQR